MVKICPTCKKFVPETAQKCPICGNAKLVLANVPASSAAAVAKATVTPKKKKSKAPVIISLFVILAIVGSVSAGVVYFLKSGITINSDSTSLKVGETSQLDIATDYSPVTYESADTTIATVDGNGTVTAINVGSTTVTATNAKGRTAKCSMQGLKSASVLSYRIKGNHPVHHAETWHNAHFSHRAMSYTVSLIQMK